MSKTVLMFPGQGSQKTDMARPFFDKIYNEASAILGYSITDVIKDPDLLNTTLYTQPAVFVTSFAWYKRLESKTGKADYLIGHSLGEWTAALIGSVISFEDALKAVGERARLMNEARSGGMAAVLGVTASQIEKELTDYPDLNIANYNLPTQTVISGNKDQIADFTSKTKAKVIPLKVSGAFHSPYMKQASESLSEFIKDIVFNDSKIPLILNSTAEETSSGELIKKSLTDQLTRPVKFYQSVEYAFSRGVGTFYEIGPSEVLTNMVKKINGDAKAVSAQEIDRGSV